MTSQAHRAVEGREATRGADRGNAALELVILAPILLALLSLVIAAGRTAVAQGSVDAAARDAARQASIALTPSAAQTAALVSARAALRQDGLDCSPAIVIDTSQFTSVPVGQPAAVTALVTCAVPLANLALPGLPGTARLSASFTSRLDTYRARSTGLGVLRAPVRLNPGMGKR